MRPGVGWNASCAVGITSRPAVQTTLVSLEESIWSPGWQILALMADAMNMDNTLTWMNNLLPVSIGRQLPMRRTILLEAPCLCCQDKQALLCQTLTVNNWYPHTVSTTDTCNNTVQLHQHINIYICINIVPFRLCNLHIAVSCNHALQGRPFSEIKF